jgi:hypothetical protein
MMLKTTLLATLGGAVTSAQLLDIPGLLASLAPAPAGDSRFTTFTPPGHGDGESASLLSILIRGESILIDRSCSPLTMPWT